MPPSPEPAYVRSPGLKAVAMDGELVMMGVDQGEYYGLRDVAASIWEHLAEPRTTTELCRLISAEYDVAPDACRPDVSAFLDDMLARRLVTAHG